MFLFSLVVKRSPLQMLVDLLPKLLVGPDDNRVICILPVLADNAQLIFGEVFRILEYGISTYLQNLPFRAINHICF